MGREIYSENQADLPGHGGNDDNGRRGSYPDRNGGSYYGEQKGVKCGWCRRMSCTNQHCDLRAYLQDLGQAARDTDRQSDMAQFQRVRSEHLGAPQNNNYQHRHQHRQQEQTSPLRELATSFREDNAVSRQLIARMQERVSQIEEVLNAREAHHAGPSEEGCEDDEGN